MTVLSNIITPSNVLTTTNTATVTNKTLTSPTVTGMTVSDGTANGVTYLNGSKVLTSGSALQFTGSNLSIGIAASANEFGNNLQINQTILNDDNAGTNHLTKNAYYSSGWKYISTDYASKYTQSLGTHQWSTAASGTAGNAISFTQAMTLDASGNLGVGTTSPQLKFVVSNAGAQGFEINPNSGIISGGIDILCYNRSAAAYKPIYTNAEYHVWATSTTERARIDSSGNLLVGTTSVAGSEKFRVYTTGAEGANFSNDDLNGSTIVTQSQNSSASTHYVMGIVNSANTVVGRITHNNSSTSFVTSSDYRLKNTIAPMTGALAKVIQLKPVTYKWNSDNSESQGFIAHELAEVVPECVVGEKDAVDADGNPKYQGIDTSFLVATLTSALQELNAKFEAYVASHP